MKTSFEAVLLAAIGLLGAITFVIVRDEVADAQTIRGRRSQFGVRRPERPLRRQPTVQSDQEHFLDHRGLRRRFVVHVPTGYDPSRHWPVVLGFHGGMGHAEGFRNQSRLNATADREGFLVVYVDGTGMTQRFLTYNAGTCCGFAVRRNIDDVGFVRALIDELPKLYSVDSRRVYATGISNGAMLCYRLAAELSDRIAAIAPVAGDMAVSGPAPSRPVPVIHFHGMKDRNVPFDGGVGDRAVEKVPHRPIPEVIAWWARANHCRPEPARVDRRLDAIRTEYEPAPGEAGAPVVLYALPEGGHTWPGGVDVTARLGTGKLVESVDADSLMWEFFKRFSLDSPVAAR